jgi:Flp pilus assembly protein TadG
MGEQRGSVLMLMPAAVLIFLVLGALCVDFGAVYGGQRELSNAAAAAANDAASQAIDVAHYYATGELRLVPARAWAVAEAAVAAHDLDRLDAHVVDVVVGDGTVTVRLGGRVAFLFAKAVPGGRDGMVVEASAEAEAAELDG